MDSSSKKKKKKKKKQDFIKRGNTLSTVLKSSTGKYH